MEKPKIIDMHTHLWLGRIGQCRDAILRACDTYGYERVYVSTLGGGALPNEAQIAECNTAAADFIRDYPGKVGGWCYVNPRHKNSLDVIKRGISDQHMVGVKLWIAALCDDPTVFPLAEYCALNNIPVLIHALDKTVGQCEFESVGMNVRNLALRYPELRIIMAHLGGNEYTGIRAIADCTNVFTDISGVIHRADTLEYAIERIGMKRLMYGTDMSGDAPFHSTLGRVHALTLSDCDKARILYQNAADFGL